MLASISEALGVNPAILDLGVAGMLSVTVYWLGRAVFVLAMERRDAAKENSAENAQQIDLEKALVNLLGTSLSESRLTREAFEKNNEVLNKNTEALAQNAKAMEAIVSSVNIMLASLKAHDDEVKIIKTDISDKLDILISSLDKKDAPIKIMLKDESGEVLAELTAIEETDDGSTLVIVMTDSAAKVEKK